MDSVGVVEVVDSVGVVEAVDAIGVVEAAAPALATVVLTASPCLVASAAGSRSRPLSALSLAFSSSVTGGSARRPDAESPDFNLVVALAR